MRWRTRVAYRFLPPHTWGQIRADWALGRRRLGRRRRSIEPQFSGREGLRLHLGCGLRDRFAWDFETLSRQLAAAGFCRITRWPNGQDSRTDLCLDDPGHAEEMLYVEAQKGDGAAQ
jgi:hypothetical protein